MLKHSSLASYPGIESCLVALIAYTSYFFSNGMHMSGTHASHCRESRSPDSRNRVSFVLRHHTEALCVPYHVTPNTTHDQVHVLRPRPTFRKFHLYLLGTEFIYSRRPSIQTDIYPGRNGKSRLYPQEHTNVPQISVVSTRYAAVFPLSELINLVHRARGQRQDELPHSYQMMLFWAGLRGAVGVALAAGFKGDNANALRTSVLVVVVLTGGHPNLACHL